MLGTFIKEDPKIVKCYCSFQKIPKNIKRCTAKSYFIQRMCEEADILIY